MERQVHILRHRKSGAWILNPTGTFRNYGATVGIYPYRELPNDAAFCELGAVAFELLQLCKRVPLSISEFGTYQGTMDEESIEIKTKYFPKKGKGSTSGMARIFSKGEVVQRDGQKSWLVLSRIWAKSELAINEQHRVRHSAGLEVLGETISRMLSCV